MFIEITMKVPRQESYIRYDGDAQRYVDLPITVNDNAVGVITEVISSDGDYVELKGFLFNSSTCFFVKPTLSPMGIEIR